MGDKGGKKDKNKAEKQKKEQEQKIMEEKELGEFAPSAFSPAPNIPGNSQQPQNNPQVKQNKTKKEPVKSE